MKTLVLLTLTIAAMLLVVAPALADEPQVAPQTEAPETTVPEPLDLSDPAKLTDPVYLEANFQFIVLLGPTWGNQNFPALAPMRATGETIVIVVDVRNGKETWNLLEDPIVLLLVPQAEGKPKTFIDSGFKAGGKATKRFEEVPAGEDLQKYFRAPGPEKTKYNL